MQVTGTRPRRNYKRYGVVIGAWLAIAVWTAPDLWEALTVAVPAFAFGLVACLVMLRQEYDQ